ncbi:hypothetical protein APED_16980 [Acanthopleuribacter pedis]
MRSCGLVRVFDLLTRDGCLVQDAKGRQKAFFARMYSQGFQLLASNPCEKCGLDQWGDRRGKRSRLEKRVEGKEKPKRIAWVWDRV